jgi:hypothetical protein
LIFVWWEKIFSYICTVEQLKTNKMTTEFKLNYIENKLRKSGNKLPNTEITFIASQLLQQCNKLNKSVYDLEII